MDTHKNTKMELKRSVEARARMSLIVSGNLFLSLSALYFTTPIIGRAREEPNFYRQGENCVSEIAFQNMGEVVFGTGM